MISNFFSRYQSIRRDYLWRAVQLLGKEGITLFIFLTCAKILSPFEFGMFNFLMAMVFFLIIFSDFGISSSTSKYVAEFSVTNIVKQKSILFNSSIAILCLASVVTVGVFLFGETYFKEVYFYFIYLLPLVFLAPMTSLYDGIYRGLNKFKLLSIITLCTGLLSLPLVVYLIMSYGLPGALIAQTTFYTILLSVLAVSYRDWNLVFDKTLLFEVCKYAFVVGIATVGYFLFSRINVLILGHYGYIEQIGYYEIINKIFVLLLIPFSILSQVIAPHVTRKYALNDTEWILAKYKSSLLFSAVASTLLATMVFFGLPFMVDRFLSEYNTSEISLMLIFLLPILITQSMSAVAATGFSTASGHARLNMYFLLFFGLLNIVLTIVLIRIFGFWGVIYSTLIVKMLSDVSFIMLYLYFIKYGKK